MDKNREERRGNGLGYGWSGDGERVTLENGEEESMVALLGFDKDHTLSCFLSLSLYIPSRKRMEGSHTALDKERRTHELHSIAQ
nr:hypothetical protein Itr_chr01CG09400 [Ipomoea trifida]GMC49203.1 hypothetical protein Iba_chr01bCG5640 [Ipomoea batatas]GMC51209.1 hypothetical protein Iba_chr01cCG4090 [Ipomoea batatas]GMC52969.1 hypothetical protein Iba_chr01dCG2310 [Ipomoea batatas]GMC86766.1 hypothetical protein Iba_chr04dCG13920 [Ipomoea batatas]